MVIDAKSDGKILPFIGHHVGSCHVGGDNDVPLFRLFFGQPLVEMGIFGGDFGIAEHMGGLSQLPQPPAQQCGGANGVPVGTAVGKNGKPIMSQKELSRFSPRQCLHRVLPRGS